jgi:hypothetical protein
LIRRGSVGRHVHHERNGSTIIKEVDRDTGWPTIVCGEQGAVEEWEEVDSSAVVSASCEDTWDSNANIGLGVW